MKTDTLFYRLFQDRPALLFALAGLPSPPPEAGYVLQAEEIKETAFRLDGAMIITPASFLGARASGPRAGGTPALPGRAPGGIMIEASRINDWKAAAV